MPKKSRKHSKGWLSAADQNFIRDIDCFIENRIRVAEDEFVLCRDIADAFFVECAAGRRMFFHQKFKARLTARYAATAAVHQHARGYRGIFLPA